MLNQMANFGDMISPILGLFDKNSITNMSNYTDNIFLRGKL